MDHHEILDRPRKPCPLYLRGEQHYLGNPPQPMTCRDVQWKAGRWVYYWAKAIAPAGNEAAQ